MDAPLPFPFDRARWGAVVRDATALFRAHPDVFDSAVKVTAEKHVRWFSSSEGAGLVTERTLYGLHVQAVARAPDGQLLEDGRDFYARAEVGAPLRRAGPRRRRAGDRRARGAPPRAGDRSVHRAGDPRAGGDRGPLPRGVGHRLEGERLEDDKDGQTFRGQVGQLVLPPFLTIVDDPTLAAANGIPLNGTYAFDEQGVAARRTVLVRDGRLETYLLSRKPVKPFERSNGHGRSQGARAPMARMANLVVESSRRVGAAELKRMLMAEARRQKKPYGLVDPRHHRRQHQHRLLRVPGVQGDAAPRLPGGREDRERRSSSAGSSSSARRSRA